jgi:hypothetical protein
LIHWSNQPKKKSDFFLSLFFLLQEKQKTKKYSWLLLLLNILKPLVQALNSKVNFVAVVAV